MSKDEARSDGASTPEQSQPDFSFPLLKQKAPLTAGATVVDRSNQDAKSMPPPPPVLLNQAQPGSSKFQPRKKMHQEQGMNQLDFLRCKKDMSGLNGGPRRRGIPKSEISEHNTPDDAWIILRGKVYNLSPYMPYHPGGKAILKQTAGKDCTKLFDKYHKWVNSDFLLQNCFIGLSE